MKRGLLLARQVEPHGPDRVRHGLAALPEREQPDTDAAEEQPHDSDHDPACQTRPR